MNLEGQAERFVRQLPMVCDGLAELPFAAALFAAVVKAVPVFPTGAGGFLMAGPDNLRVGTDERVRAPTLLFHAVAAFEELIVAPAIGDDEGGTRDVGGHI